MSNQCGQRFGPRRIASSVAVPSRSLQASAEVLQSLAKLADAAADSISSCLDEITGSGSDAIRAVRIRAQQLARLMQLYDSAHAVGDDLTTVSAQQPRNHEQQQDHQQQQQQPGQGTASSESGKRLGRIAALEALVAELELAGARAGELRRMCVEAAAAHAALCDMRSEPGTMQAQLMGHRDALLMPEDKEQVDKLQRQLTAVEVQVPLARDQLGVALQAVEYAQAASQLTEGGLRLQVHAAACTYGRHLRGRLWRSSDQLQRVLSSCNNEQRVERMSYFALSPALLILSSVPRPERVGCCGRRRCGAAGGPSGCTAGGARPAQGSLAWRAARGASPARKHAALWP